jgi:hypothetical protein
MTMLVFLLKWLIFYHTPQCLVIMVALLLQPPLLFFCNVPLLYNDDVVIGFTTICYVHLYCNGFNVILLCCH